jgi:hypothetical protein
MHVTARWAEPREEEVGWPVVVKRDRVPVEAATVEEEAQLEGQSTEAIGFDVERVRDADDVSQAALHIDAFPQKGVCGGKVVSAKDRVQGIAIVKAHARCLRVSATELRAIGKLKDQR